jgi:hypothetical protein
MPIKLIGDQLKFDKLNCEIDFLNYYLNDFYQTLYVAQ